MVKKSQARTMIILDDSIESQRWKMDETVWTY